MAQTKPNPRRRRRVTSTVRRRRRSSRSTSTALARRNPQAMQARNPRRSSRRAPRRSYARRSNPSLRQLGGIARQALLGAVGAFAVNALANLNPYQARLSPWAAVGVKGGLSYLLGYSEKVIGANNAAAIQTGALIATAIDALTLIVPWASQQVPVIFSQAGQAPTVATAPAANTSLSGLVDIAGGPLNIGSGMAGGYGGAAAGAGSNMGALVNIPEASPLSAGADWYHS